MKPVFYTQTAPKNFDVKSISLSQLGSVQEDLAWQPGSSFLTKACFQDWSFPYIWGG